MIHFLVYKITDIIPRNPPKVKFPALSEEFSALYVSGFCHIHDKTPRGILPVNSNRKITQHKDTKDNSIPAKCLEIMFLDISHQEFDRQDRYHKRYQYTYDQDDQLCRAEGKTEFHKLQKTCAKHNRNCQEKGKLSRTDNSDNSSDYDNSDNGSYDGGDDGSDDSSDNGNYDNGDGDDGNDNYDNGDSGDSDNSDDGGYVDDGDNSGNGDEVIDDSGSDGGNGDIIWDDNGDWSEQ